MKITQSESIRVSEKEFIDTINAELDWGTMEAMLLERHNFHLRDEVEYKGGDLVVHGDRIAYKLDFEIKLSVSVVVGRDGNCLAITSSADSDPDLDLDLEEDGFPDLADGGDGRPSAYPTEDTPAMDMSSMASSLAAMISDINQEGD